MQAATRQEQKVVTRDRLVNAAMALFARKGIVSTTTADVAKAVRMSHGVLFLHFPTRDDLVIAVIDEFGRRKQIEKTFRTMPTHFLLTTEVRRPEDLEHADFLLGTHPQAAQALDLLLGTQGWRRFAEQQNPAEFRLTKERPSSIAR